MLIGNKRLLCGKFWKRWEVAFLLLKGTELSREESLCDSDGKEFTCNAGDPGSTPGLGRLLGEGNGNPPQYSFFSVVLWYPFISFFPIVFISWRLITLQYCSGFCHTLTWTSHGFTCVPHPEPPSHLLPHPVPLGHPSAPAMSTYLMHPTWTGDLFHTW